MQEITALDLRRNLRDIMLRCLAGERFAVTRDGVPVCRLEPPAPQSREVDTREGPRLGQ